MSDLTSHNPDNNPSNNSSNYRSSDYELVTGYIDNQLTQEEKNHTQYLIDSDNDFYNRYIFEKSVKDILHKHNQRIDTPVYLYKNIGKEIDDYVTSARRSKIINSDSYSAPTYFSHHDANKSNLRKYLLYSSFAFVVLIGLAFLLNNFLKNNPLFKEDDFVSVSRNVFDKIESGDVKIQHKCNNAKELADTMNKYLDFKSFVPDVKDATLVGGVCNEIQGEKVAHIIHKKGNVIIYTLQANLKEVMSNEENKIILSDPYKENVQKGKNWFPCNKDKKRTAVIWFRDNVICSTVAELDSQEISSVLTNYK